MVKRIIGILLFVALLPVTAFNVLLVWLTFVHTEYLKTLIIFIPSLCLLLWLQIIFWRLFHDRQTNKRIAAEGALAIRCHCCGGSNTVSGTKLGQCKYCSTKLRLVDRI